MITVENISANLTGTGNSRRDFLRGLLSAGAFVLSARYLPAVPLAAANASATRNGIADIALKGPLSPSVYLAIDTDGTVYAIAHRSEMGSGSRTALPRIIADELDADWARVKIVQGHRRRKIRRSGYRRLTLRARLLRHSSRNRRRSETHARPRRRCAVEPTGI